MKITEKEIFEMEKQLINKHFKGIEPREIELVGDDTFNGRAGEKLEINRSFLDTCTEAELIVLLKHELIHYSLPGYGHDKDFLDKAEEVGSTIGSYEVNAYVEQMQPLGFLEEVFDVNTEIVTYVHHKKPQWKLFMHTISNNRGHGYFLKRLREYTHLSQEQVASEAGISVDRLAEIEEADNWNAWNRTTFLYLFDEEEIKRVFETIASKYEKET